MPIFDHFGFFAPYYDRVFQHGDRSWLFELMQLPTDGLVLDVGGGTGRIAQLFRDQVKSVVVADLSIKMLQQANAKGGLLTAGSHSEFLPFATNSFDRIMMIDALDPSNAPRSGIPGTRRTNIQGSSNHHEIYCSG